MLLFLLVLVDGVGLDLGLDDDLDDDLVEDDLVGDDSDELESLEAEVESLVSHLASLLESLDCVSSLLMVISLPIFC